MRVSAEPGVPNSFAVGVVERRIARAKGEMRGHQSAKHNGVQDGEVPCDGALEVTNFRR